VKRSALGVAALRYAGSFEADPEVRNPDRAVGALLPRRLAAMARIAPLRRCALPLYRRAYPGSYEYHIARTRLIDGLLLEALAAGVEQVVILGAGLDTRAQRFADRLNGARVIELDLPGTSEYKREALAARRIRTAASLLAVDLDREGDRLGAILERHDFDPTRPAFFIWEGVSMFLGPEAVEATLALVARGPGTGSIVFDYVLRAVVEGDRLPLGAAQTARYLERSGEPWRFGLDIAEVEPYLSERGFATELNLGPAELEQAYLRRGDGSLVGSVVGFHGIAHATAAQT
jgi:methyltransferase (TIGR00027 family)